MCMFASVILNKNKITTITTHESMAYTRSSIVWIREHLYVANSWVPLNALLYRIVWCVLYVCIVCVHWNSSTRGQRQQQQSDSSFLYVWCHCNIFQWFFIFSCVFDAAQFASRENRKRKTVTPLAQTFCSIFVHYSFVLWLL